ncbi:protein boule-like [Montipora foliosa]|uniref:protein boule-like n=1 Tax=Montipora foliosa TaxID=591990 RepID=UPI0035F19802
MDNQSTYLFGRRFKNRLFVGGLPLNTTAKELAEFFSLISPVVEAKVIKDENHIPKGYGFVTFQNEEAVHQVTGMGTLFLKNKKLNLGPAVKKQATAVEPPELVVVNTVNMRGEYFYPVSVPQYYQYPVYTCPTANHGLICENQQPTMMPVVHYQAVEQPCLQPLLHLPASSRPDIQIGQPTISRRRKNVPPRFRPH